MSKYKTAIVKTIQIILLTSLLQITISQTPTRNPTPTPVNEPTEFPTQIPYQLCCDCTDISPDPGCAIDPDCEDEICINQGDTFCCNDEWDIPCAKEAESICFPPTLSPTRPPVTTLPLCCACIEPSDDPYCPADLQCQSLICAA
eukprot:510880_1